MQTAKETLTIHTPEHVGFQYVLAGLGSRASAFLLDTAIRALLIFFIFIVIILLSQWLPSLVPTGLPANLPKSWIMALGVLAYGLVDLGYFLLFEALWSGQTPGKRQQKLRVIRVNGQPIGWLESAIRNILRAADLLAGVYPMGLIVMFLSQRTQRIGDYAAGTVVVVERRHNVPKDRTRLRHERVEIGSDIEPLISTLEPKQYQILRSFLQRRQEMDRSHRQELARVLAHRLLERWGISPKLKASYEAFLEEVVGAYERSRRAI
jgi:uncharacterized RDD family membrane protein YckC